MRNQNITQSHVIYLNQEWLQEVSCWKRAVVCFLFAHMTIHHSSSYKNKSPKIMHDIFQWSLFLSLFTKNQRVKCSHADKKTDKPVQNRTTAILPDNTSASNLHNFKQLTTGCLKNIFTKEPTWTQRDNNIEYATQQFNMGKVNLSKKII